MKDKEIINFLRVLDSEVPRDSAKVELRSFGEVALYANKEGYMRFAIELLKCAFDETASEAELNYLFTTESEFGIDHLTRSKEEFNFISE